MAARFLGFMVLWYGLTAVAQDSALPALLERYRAEPDDYRLCQEIGVSYTRSGQLDSAAEFFRKAIRLRPDFLPARKNLATVLWFLQRKQESEREFEALAKRLPDDPVPHLYLGLAAYDRGQYSEAIAHWEKSGGLAGENPEVLPAMAEAYNQVNQPERALAAYRRWIAAVPDSADAYTAFAAFAAGHRNNAFALSVVEEGLQRAPGAPKLLLEQGILLAEDGRYERAAASFHKSAEGSPQWPLPLLALGVSQLERGQFREAAASFREAIRRAPGDDRSQYLLATALKRDPGSSGAMTAALRKAITLNPRNVRARVALAEFDLASGRLPEAVAELERALAAEPENTAALYQLGRAYRRRGEDEKARQVLEKFQRAKNKAAKEESELVQILKAVPASPGSESSR